NTTGRHPNRRDPTATDTSAIDSAVLKRLGVDPSDTADRPPVNPCTPIESSARCSHAQGIRFARVGDGGPAMRAVKLTVGVTTKIDFTATPVGQKLSRNTALNSKLVTRLQAAGYTGSVYQAAYGFKNLGQFVAATNVSKNLGIPFEQLKVQMTGVKVAADGTVMKAMIDANGKVTLVDPSKTTDSSLSPAATKSLGQSIQTLKSGVDSTAAAQTATKQADAEIAGTSTAGSTSGGTTSTTSAAPAASTTTTSTTSTST